MSDSLTTQIANLPESIKIALAATPARLFTGRTGAGLLTTTSLQLRSDHAAARDAVYVDIQLRRDFNEPWLQRHRLFEIGTQATSRTEYLLRPDKGRLLNAESALQFLTLGDAGADIQVVLGDGLSARAVIKHAPPLLDLLADQVKAANWYWGNPFLIHHCRVGIMNDIGRLLQPKVVVLLIGERPGLAQSDSLSAYLAYRPQPGHTDAQRNLISNIHQQGVSIPEAAHRIMQLVQQMFQKQVSGVQLKEEPLLTSVTTPRSLELHAHAHR